MIVTDSVPAEIGHATLACSQTLGCAVTLPPGEHVQNVTIGDAQYAVKVQSDGASSQPRILIYPMRDGAEAARMDILSNIRSYVVVIDPTASQITRSLAFTERPPLPPRFIPSHENAVTDQLPETATLDPQWMTYNWQYKGNTDFACQSAFEYRHAAVWCKLPNTLFIAPSVYALSGKEYRPVDTRIVDRSYLVIESIDGPFEIDGTVNGIARRGSLEQTR